MLAGALALICSMAYATQPKMIITWGGNTPGWNKKLHLNGIRIGCSSAPAGCVEAAQKIASQQHVDKVFLSVALMPLSPSYAQQYSALSAANPVLYSVGFDDFVNQIDRLRISPSQSASLVRQFINNLKSANSNLHFGVTIYENELARPEITATEMTDVRNQIDFVHLYVHYRENGPRFTSYVRTAKNLFPNAAIIAGSYAIDRIDYLPCSPAAHTLCTASQEISLFEQTFDSQLRLLQDGTIVGIEFYPGNFGNVQSSSMWRDPRSCKPDRLPECIADSKKMRDYVGQVLSKQNL